MACTWQAPTHRAEPATALRSSGSPNRGSPIASRRARRRDDGDLPGEFLLSSSIWARAALTRWCSRARLVPICPRAPRSAALRSGRSGRGRWRQLDDVGALADYRELLVAGLAPELRSSFPAGDCHRSRSISPIFKVSVSIVIAFLSDMREIVGGGANILASRHLGFVQK